nr:immunoglobulin heavy chain junction region [Mus musculus]
CAREGYGYDRNFDYW